MLKRFFTYFSGYDTNRKNYYESKDEKATAVATRIIHENLPTFCNNSIRFEKKKDEYTNAYQCLKELDKTTQIKDSITGKFQETEPIAELIFDINYFNQCLSQPQIEEYNRIIGNYNSLINLYNQAKQHEKDFKKLDAFEKLRKQIGCGNSKSFFDVLIKDKECELTEDQRKTGDILTVEKLLQTAKAAGEKMFKYNQSKTTEINSLPAFVDWLKSNDNWDGIYWSKAAVNKISARYFANWHELKDALKDNKACASFDKEREEQIKLNDAIELSGLFAVIDEEKTEFVFKESLLEKNNLDKELLPSKNLINILCADITRNILYFLEESANIVALEKYKEEKKGEDDEDQIINQIKKWFDASIETMGIVRYFAVRKNKMKGNIANPVMEEVLSNLLYNDEINWFKWYDLIRNYLTKKPQDDAKKNKLKLNFDCSNLLNGWSDGQEKVKRATLLIKENDIFLCILRNSSVFDTSKSNAIYRKDGQAGRLIMKKLEFKTLAGKGFVGKFNQTYSDMGKENPAKAMQCLKEIIKERYVNKYPLLQKILNNTYTDKKIFDEEIKEMLSECYECYFEAIDWEIVKEKEASNELFLFRIHTKDFNLKSTGKKDLQTIYWKNVLEENSMHQLCAKAQIFMRNPLETIPIKHKMGEKLVNRKDTDGMSIPNGIYMELCSFFNGKKNKNLLSKEANSYIDNGKITIKDVKQEITKDKRFYFESKYFFHCPIRMNYNSKQYKDSEMKYARLEVNSKINNALKQNKNLQFIGIDRGEKHLIYKCILNKDEKIIKCEHHDVINGTNYVKKLEEKADERLKSRQNWQTIGNIRNLKDGYISHAVHYLVNDAIKDDNDEINPHSYIVLEDLSTEMKRGRQKIEKQVYQKLETALAKKFNFIVDKDSVENEGGSITNALQLTPPLKNYQNIEAVKQFGIMLYTRANYTSITDPSTGWRKTIYLYNGSEDKIKEQILNELTDFGYDGKDYYFDYTEKNANHAWRLYSGKDGVALPRFRNKKQQKEDYNVWIPEFQNVVSILDDVFRNFDKTKSFKEQIEKGTELSKVKERNETAWQSLRFAIDLIQQIRNSGIKDSKDENFLYSPVRNNNGEHFDTRNWENNGELKLIKDADANGAYNIARKGIIMGWHIKACQVPNDLNLFISDEEWDLWLLDRAKWQERLSEFSSKGMFKNKKTRK